MRPVPTSIAAGLLLLQSAAATAQQGQTVPVAAAAARQEQPAPVAPPALFVSTHRANIGAPLAYRAVAGETYVRGLDGNPAASIFSISYLREGVADRGTRPVIFAFNGGPGSASFWLNMGLLGPRRVVLPAAARDVGGGPVRLADNEFSPLDVADIVLIDPVGTGYSRAIGGHADREYWGVAEDAEVLANFVRQWLTDHGRWGSPKYLLGESYAAPARPP